MRLIKTIINLIPNRSLRMRLRKKYKHLFGKSIGRRIGTMLVKKKTKKCGKNLNASYGSKINNNTYLGNNVNFNGMKIQGEGKVVIGNHFHSGYDCLILSQNHDYNTGDAIPFSKDVNIKKNVTIGNCVWFGSKVTILPGTTIEDGAIIQAGAVVHGVIPKGAIAGGNPAKVFKYRDMDHYNKLKKQKKFN